MLHHPSGMIGLPLRLLAREVYDRVVAERGSDQVALVTGEEKRIGRNARYWVCTVEAMPLDRRVAFLAVDEVQLIAHRGRGHVFTDRVLHARGLLETWFMGSDTAEPLLRELVGGLELEGAPRLSTLRYAGVCPLGSVPRRSAVVAFSVDKVYALAERLRARHGGVAVVLGALSPAARNAQVALYQSGEVGHLVATDAIGMGLNLDVEHVAFSAVRKFDGRRVRDLSAAELAQIAGRAGRHKTDGTFGLTGGLDELDPDVVSAIEQHRFVPIARAWWRNSVLDFSSPEALVHSLEMHPPSPRLARVNGEADQVALERLLASAAVRSRLGSPERLARLWSVCAVPDYRRLGNHADLVEQLAVRLLDHGELAEDWVGEALERLDRTDGDIETLTGRIAMVRTWTYAAYQKGWLPRADHWQEASQALEARLSDALHQALLARFVDRRAMVAAHGAEAVADEQGVVAADGVVLGRLEGLSFRMEGDASRRTRAAVRRAVRPALNARLEQLVRAPEQVVQIDPEGAARWDGHAIGWVQRSPERLRPHIRVAHLDLLDAFDTQRVRAALGGLVAHGADRLMEPLRLGDHEGLEHAGRAVLFELELGLGLVAARSVADRVRRLSPAERNVLKKRDVRLGVHTVFVASRLTPADLRCRALLWCVHNGVFPMPQAPGSNTSVRIEPGVPAAFYEAVGFRCLGPRAVRVDLLERVAARLRAARRGEPARRDELLSWLGCPMEELHAIAGALGYRLRGDDTLTAKRERRPRRSR
jgi:ATP-dependent RNA helicase SUPV3L1/SUV3